MILKPTFAYSLCIICSCLFPRIGGASEFVQIEFVDVFSYDLQGSIPPNATLEFDIAQALGVASAPYDVIGIGWEVTIDAFGPSWLSDVSIAIGSDESYQQPSVVLVPGLGDDFFDLRTYDSGGVRDLTNWDGTGQDLSFVSENGEVYLEFFESFDDFIGFPDAWFRDPSSITLEVERVPEPRCASMLLIVGALLSHRIRASAMTPVTRMLQR